MFGGACVLDVCVCGIPCTSSSPPSQEELRQEQEMLQTLALLEPAEAERQRYGLILCWQGGDTKRLLFLSCSLVACTSYIHTVCTVVHTFSHHHHRQWQSVSFMYMKPPGMDAARARHGAINDTTTNAADHANNADHAHGDQQDATQHGGHASAQQHPHTLNAQQPGVQRDVGGHATGRGHPQGVGEAPGACVYDDTCTCTMQYHVHNTHDVHI